MDISEFIGLHIEKMKGYAIINETIGERPDYVQGGGGNTSVKFADGTMAIKASGYTLKQTGVASGYALLDARIIRAFFAQPDASEIFEIEAKAQETINAARIKINGMPYLRPSVEAGFHSILSNFVLHTHSVYANLITCCKEGKSIAQRIFENESSEIAFVPYSNPGATLTFEIMNAISDIRQATSREPSVIFLENHGLIVSNDDAESCIAMNENLNRRIANAYGINVEKYPSPKLVKTGENQYKSASPYLLERISKLNQDTLITQVLYPDQLVYLQGSLAFSEAASEKPAKCTINIEQNSINYVCSENEAKAIEETITALMFVRENILENGYTLSLMNASAKSYVSGWESEKYRKNVLSGEQNAHN